MSKGGNYIEIAGGKIIELAEEDYILQAGGNIISEAAKTVTEIGLEKGVSFDEYVEEEEKENQSKMPFEVSIKLADKTVNSFVPLGIPNFEGAAENAYIEFEYTLSKDDIDEIIFEIVNETDKRVLYKNAYLQEVTVTGRYNASHPPSQPKANTNKVPDYTKQGSYTLQWNGFDDNGIYDSTQLHNKTLKARVVGIKQGIQVMDEVEFTPEYKQVEWVDVKISQPQKTISVTLRVNLTDGGAQGLEAEQIINGQEPFYNYPWENVPPKATVANGNIPPLRTRTRSFEELEKLAIEGLNYHWGRNRNHLAAKDVKINNESYEVYINATNMKERSMDDMELIYNTNGDWMRSGNPAKAQSFRSVIGNIISGERIAYNIGYLNNVSWYEIGKKDWYYADIDRYQIDEDFSYTAAHEIGHTILQAYGGTNYSYTHDGTSKITQEAILIKDGGKSYYKEKESGEVNLMHYFEDEPWQGKVDYKLLVASQKDVLSLIWLTKIKVL